MTSIFIAATRQNDGKTTVSLGLFSALLKRDSSFQYMKPVGQQYRIIDNNKIDKDAVLIQKAFGLNPQDLPFMSPVASPRGFTEAYIRSPNNQALMEQITNANDYLCQGASGILYEGTGHAGVGSVFDLSNASVAQLLKTPVIIVSIGGIGKAIDEIMLNVSVFKEKGVPILGVILNKVLPEKFEKINTIARNGLSRLGLDLLGIIPVNQDLTYPTISSIIDELKPTVLSISDDSENNIIEKFMIGDMMPHDALDHINRNTLMIVPGNREGLVLTALCENLVNKTDHLVSGIIFTNGIKPHNKILDLLKQSSIPLFMLEEDAFKIATKINQMIVKIRFQDTNKISIAESMVNQYVDIDAIYSKIS